MQSLFETLHRATGARLSLVIGLVLLGAVLVQIFLEIARALSRFGFERKQQSAVLERLRLQVDETRVRTQKAEQVKAVWNGFRKFTVSRKAMECEDVCA